MKLWIAGSLEQVRAAAATGLASAIVTNPTVVAQWTATARLPIEDIAAEVASATKLPVYIQLRGPDADTFLAEAEALRRYSPFILPKLPSTTDGLVACQQLTARNIPVLVTTVCSVNQAYLAAVAGATTICPYYARLGESGRDPAAFIASVAQMYERNGVQTEILPASVRTLEQAEAALMAGASGLILFDDLFRKLCEQDVTTSSLAAFERDWAKTLYRFSKNLPA